MDHGTMDATSLVSRLVQLEQERDELRSNAEHAFISSSGIFSGLDIVSRIHGWRSSELGQELDNCGKKLHACQKENAKLQEELEEVYSIKSKFAEQLKMEVEKSAGLEKDVKYFQNKVASAFSDRDWALLEAEKLQRKRDGLLEKVTDLQDRLEQVTSECTEEKALCEVLYGKLEKLKEENDLHKKVTEKFWRVQEQTANNVGGVEDIQKRAAVLLEGPESLWYFGQLPSYSDAESESKQVQTEQKLAICQESMEHLQIRYEKELSARKQAEHNLLNVKSKLFYVTERFGKELQQLNLLRKCLKKEALSFVFEEKKEILSLQEVLHFIMNVHQRKAEKPASIFGMDNSDFSILQMEQEESIGVDARFSCSSRASSEGPDASNSKDLYVHSNREELILPLRKNSVESATAMQPSEASCLSVRSENTGSVMEDTLLQSADDGKALAQALQEKVAALLLLSQQEERYILESNTTFALESQISSLKQQLIQVTREKMDALVRLSRTQEKCLKLQEQEKTFTKLIQQHPMLASFARGSVEEPSVYTNGNENLNNASSRKSLMQSYLKHIWSRGQGVGIQTSLSTMFSLRQSKEVDEQSDARLEQRRGRYQKDRTNLY